jgi:acetyltransferase-like isoleucine patch superfamily enzyme
MKAITTVGWRKAIRFIWYELVTKALHIILVPQMRSFILRLDGARIGKDSVILDASFTNLYHYGFRRLEIGQRCFVGDEVLLDLRGSIRLEDDVTLSNRAAIITHINVGYADHPLQKAYPTVEETVIIEKGAYVGTGAIVLPGVRVGKESVVGAGAVVTRNVPKRVVVAGVPARVIKKI